MEAVASVSRGKMNLPKSFRQILDIENGKGKIKFKVDENWEVKVVPVEEDE